jgi:RNA polymerase sigma-70 factor (ECF subfamily)
MDTEANGARAAARDAAGLPDVEVVRRVLHGEAALFEILMRRYNQRLYRAARSIVKDDGESDRLASGDPGPEEQALTGELRRALEAALDGLPAMYRVVFVLREVEGLGTAEVAQCLETTEDVVKTRLHRARLLLQRELLSRAGAGARHAFTFRAFRCDRVVGAVLARVWPLAARIH